MRLFPTELCCSGGREVEEGTMLSTKVGAQELAAPTAFLMVPAARSAEITKNVVAESTLMNVIVK